MDVTPFHHEEFAVIAWLLDEKQRINKHNRKWVHEAWEKEGFRLNVLECHSKLFAVQIIKEKVKLSMCLAN
jgi:hypothetical protein